MRGSIRHDKPGGWSFVVDVPGDGGNRRQLRRRGFPTKRAAQAALADLLSSVSHGTFVRPARTTVASFFDEWLQSLPTAGRKATTIDSYRRAIHLHVLPALGGVELQVVTALDLDRLYARLATEGRKDGRGGLSLRHVRYVHAIVRKALGDAERKGLVQRNVARFASPPGVAATRAPEMLVWTPAELRAFLEANREHHHGPAFRLAAMSGLRRAEVCGLRWTDVDLDAGELTVRQTIATIGHRTVLGDTKTARSRRTVSLDAETVGVLRTHRSRQLEQRLLVGVGWVDHGTVFAMPDGRAWHPNTISQAFDRAVARSGLPRIRFHDLRHTHASHLLAAGVNVKVVSERLGHASTSFTLDVYGHVMPGQQASAAAAVAALVDGG